MFNASTVPELIAAIETANQNGESDSISLAAGTTFTLTETNNSNFRPTGLPTIVASEHLTILGNGSVIERSAAAETPPFRLLHVATGASLSLMNLTLQGGSSVGWPLFGGGGGGAIYSEGDLALSDVTVQNNIVLGRPGLRVSRFSSGEGGWGLGGGIYSTGSLLLENSTLRNNSARGGRGGVGSPGYPGGRGGNGYGGGLYVAGSATLLGSAVTDNSATRGGGGTHGIGRGGGLYIAGAQVVLDAFTLAHITSNSASTSDPDIYGPFEVIADPNPLPGDFNNDGTIDAADYVIWRKTGGSPGDYTTWRTNFGSTFAGGGSSADTLDLAVPEPHLLTSLWFAAATLLCVRNRSVVPNNRH
jgi:hypothetical protein